MPEKNSKGESSEPLPKPKGGNELIAEALRHPEQFGYAPARLRAQEFVLILSRQGVDLGQIKLEDGSTLRKALLDSLEAE